MANPPGGPAAQLTQSWFQKATGYGKAFLQGAREGMPTAAEAAKFGKDFFEGVKEAAQTSANLTADAALYLYDRNVLQPALEENRAYLKTVTGSNALNELLREQAEKLVPTGKTAGQLEHLLKRHPQLSLDTFEANLSLMLINLVKKAKHLTSEQKLPAWPDPIDSTELLAKVIALIGQLEKEKIEQLSFDARLKTTETERVKFFSSISENLLLEAFPKGKESLILPDTPYFHPIRGLAFQKIKEQLPTICTKPGNLQTRLTRKMWLLLRATKRERKLRER